MLYKCSKTDPVGCSRLQPHNKCHISQQQRDGEVEVNEVVNLDQQISPEINSRSQTRSLAAIHKDCLKHISVYFCSIAHSGEELRVCMERNIDYSL